MENIRKYNLSMVREKTYKYDGMTANTASNAADVLRAIGYADRPYETAGAIFLDTKLNVIGISEISNGTIDGTLFNPRDFIVRALLCNAKSMIVWHNHPSGNCEPSEDDIRSTLKLQSACEIMGLDLCDHIILGDNNYCSMRERGDLT